MSKLFVIQGQNIEVTKKNIKNIYLRANSSNGRIALSAPKHISDETIRLFILSKLDWLKKRQKKIQQSIQLTNYEYTDKETHYIWGNAYILSIIEKDAPAIIELTNNTIILTIKPGANFETKKQIINKWSREELRLHAIPLIEKWSPILGVSINKLYVRYMKTYWGSCNTHAHTIRLNTELVKKPPECLEYVVVHELVHLLEPSHNKNFHRLMTAYLPDWKQRKELLSNFPLIS